MVLAVHRQRRGVLKQRDCGGEEGPDRWASAVSERGDAGRAAEAGDGADKWASGVRGTEASTGRAASGEHEDWRVDPGGQ